MGRDNKPVDLENLFPEFIQWYNSLDVLFKSKNKHVALIRGYLVSAENKKSVLLSELVYRFTRPDVVMVGKAQAIEADSFGFSYQVNQGGGTARGGFR